MGNNNHYFLLSVTITISIIIHHLLEFSSIYSIRHHPIGLATVFNAPIGGLLFSIEVTSTYYLISNYWKSFMAAVAGGDSDNDYGGVGDDGDSDDGDGEDDDDDDGDGDHDKRC